MAVPRNRHSNARKNTRRAHMAHKPKRVGKCESCGATALPHCACTSCGNYRGRQVSKGTDQE